MNLAQALKHKSRLAGELVRQQKILRRENSRRSDNPSKVDCAKVWTAIESLSNELGAVKSAIARANVGIYAKIDRMAELKAQIAFIDSLEKREGEEVCLVGRNDEKLIYNWKSFFNQEKADEIENQLQKQINQLQDEIDAYNATTQITL